MVKLVVGLGNPGKAYEKTRHNVGFMSLDRLAGKVGASLSKKKLQGVFGEWNEGEIKAYLLKPQTFMNCSGDSVQPFVQYNKISGENFMVVHDDLDLPLGVLKAQWGAGAGGQKGVASIIEKLGHQNFCRLRIGIGRPFEKNRVVDYVLHPFAGDELPLAEEIIDRSVEAIQLFVKKGLDPVMQMFNRKNP
jgi:PTH1 family peptidyl-tRNA hydrolase